jgi:AcrR family transcriptional regulator
MRKERRRGLILDAARRVFAARGYHDTTVSDIIDAAGIARGTFYLYFESKRAVFQELIDQFVVALRNCVRRIRIGPDHPPPYDQMRANVSRIMALLLEEREVTVILLNHAVGLDRECDETLRRFDDEIAERLVGALERGRRLGLSSTADPEIAARQILGGVKEVVRYLVIQGAAEREHEALVDGVLRMMISGLVDVPLEHLLRPVGSLAGALPSGTGRDD